MPRYRLAVPGHFTKEMRAPADDIFANQVLDGGDNAGVGQNIMHTPVIQMCGADAVAVAAGGKMRVRRSSKYARSSVFRVIENRHRRDVALLVRVRDLPRRECSGRGVFNPPKAQIAILGGDVRQNVEFLPGHYS